MSSFTLLLCTLFSSSMAFQSSSLSIQQEARLLKLASSSPSLRQELPWSQQRRRASATILGVGFSMESNDDVQYLYAKARDCAYSAEDGGEECSIDDATHLLQDLTFLLSQCTYGNMRNQNTAICKDQDVAADIVSRLRVKASSSSSSASAVVAGAAPVVESEEEEQSITWKSTFAKLELPVAVLYYFACIFFMMNYGHYGVNDVDIAETTAKVHEYYTSTTTLPPSFFHHGIF
ncbi:unnamed protein product [Cylindrotheca closterium]|uniref:Uncharacterized protein n=1 Tax=Cylindrotheca closterium TaxID=2856 RepID=A0AAD2CKE8_9STRA|nr:unnamed protein product [Cylindrotheca closterium]